MIKAYIDASVKGNPGSAGGGILLIDNTGRQRQLAFALPGKLSNHQAEFAVFVNLLDLLLQEKSQHETIMVYSDSKVLVSTVDKNHIANTDFLPYLELIQQKLVAFELLILQWLPEANNKGADNLARQGLKKALKLQNW